MRKNVPRHLTLGYCTNVHAGATLDASLANLEQHAQQVRKQVAPAGMMGVGLWLSARAVMELFAQQRVAELKDRLQTWGLVPFTCNGFPYGDFHEPVVKHRVYEPNWTDPRRRTYTLQLAQLLTELTGAGQEASISTLPVGWPGAPGAPVDLEQAAAELRRLARELGELESRTGTWIHVNLEPEPGCLLDQAEDVVRFFAGHLWRGTDAGMERLLRRHVRVCHDICHAAVMGEDQVAVLRRYAQAGIGVGKVQVSSAVRVDFDAPPPAARAAALEQLRTFVEPKYLHQTTIAQAGEDVPRLYEDLPLALAEATGGEQRLPGGMWRVHFHVPIFLESLGVLGTTQAEIGPCVREAVAQGVKHFEVETYAWGVLPAEHRPADLAAGIAREMLWLTNLMRSLP